MSGHLCPDSILYTHEHVWLREEPNGIATVGITDFAQDQLGEIAFVDLPAVGAAFADGDEFGTVESIKSVSALYMPVAGIVLAVNEELTTTPTQVIWSLTAADGCCEFKYTRTRRVTGLSVPGNMKPV